MKTIVVPINVSLNHLKQGKTVMNALADFSKQPWNDGTRDYNSDYPYIGETVLAEAFQNDTLYLEPEVHLFWEIPRALRTANLHQTGNDKDQQKFPCVPNRWLINKLDSDQKPIKQWVVESDFLSVTPDAGENKNPINIAIPIDGTRQPYRYMGRQLSLDEWRQGTTPESGNYWKDYFKSGLTALGYGEPSFSTFYPNCRSVFGCWDSDPMDDSHTYEVLGWYTDSSDELFNSAQSIEEQADLLHRYNWKLEGNDLVLDGTVFYGRVNHSPNQTITPPQIESVSIGYTGAEAVSAYLATVIDGNNNAIDGNKNKTEETLEAILFGSKIKNGSIDSVANFQEARHQKGFDGEEGGLLWTLRETLKKTDPDAEPTPIPTEVAEKLNALNLAQQAYNQATLKLELLNFQLYSDWSKYIQACYPPLGEGQDFPDIDEIKAFIGHERTTKIIKLQDTTGSLSVNPNTANDTFTVSYASGYPQDNLAQAVYSTFETLKHAMPNTWEINKITSARFYTPKDPVVMFAGDVKDFSYLNQTKLPELLTEISSFKASEIKTNPEVSQESMEVLLNIQDQVKDFISTNATWQPQIFQWLTEFFPVKQGANLGSNTNTFSDDYITSNFELQENAFDFDPKSESIQDGFQYAGSTYLSGSVKSGYIKKLQAFIDKSPDGKPKETAKAALEILNQKFIISQSMGGFHQALLQHRHNIHLPIEDPLGFSEYQAFTTLIKDQLQGHQQLMAPLPAEQFLPIRAGGMRLSQLKLTDQFGEESQAPVDSIISNQALNISPDTNIKWLPPRLCQPARLNLRWLSAVNSSVEVNNLLNTSPVCGWVVANYLNNNLVFYQSDGTQLGYFAPSGEWYSALGVPDQDAFKAEDITGENPKKINDQLLQVLLYIKEQIGTPDPSTVSDFLQAYLDTLETAQDNIYPASTAIHDATALLMSKPMAIVQAKVGFELKGGARYDQGWDALTANMKLPYTRTTDGYENVVFPIRLGEQKQLDDGLVGYWINNSESTFEEDTFFANTAGDNRTGIIHHDLLQKSLESTPDTLTVLMDPRAILHASTGILPVKTIQIPPEHYTTALRKIEVDFLTAPVISSVNEVSISTPLEKDKAWEWMSKTSNDKTEQEAITSFDTSGTFTPQKIKEGWLRLKNSSEK